MRAEKKRRWSIQHPTPPDGCSFRGPGLGDLRTKPISMIGTERQQTVQSQVSGVLPLREHLLVTNRRLNLPSRCMSAAVARPRVRPRTRSSASPPDAHKPRSSPSIAARRSGSTNSTEAGRIAELQALAFLGLLPVELEDAPVRHRLFEVARST
jgi:hypothetical protein